MNRLQDIEMAESLGLKDSSYSCRAANQANLDSMKKNMRYRCYQCGGDAYKSSTCRACSGLKEVKDNNVMVELMFQVMCCKLGKDVPTLRNFPKLQFSSQHKIGSKASKNKAQQKKKEKYLPNKSASKVTRQHFSQGNSLNDSNSLDSSLDSLDSSKNNRSTISSKQKLQRNKQSKNSSSYFNQPHFKQQISEIKQQSYATQDYSVVCQCCHKQGETGLQFLQCKVCKHYFICSKCYQQKVQQLRNNQSLQKQPIISMKRQKSMMTILHKSEQNLENNQKNLQGIEKYNSCQYMIKQNDNQSKQDKKQIVNYDNFFKIHQHPLTRYVYQNQDEEVSGKQKKYGYNDYIKQDAKKNYYSGQDQIQLTYGSNRTKSFENSSQQKYEDFINYKNLFKVYDPPMPESPTSKKANQNQYLNFEVIKEEKQSPSPSQKSSSQIWQSNPKQSLQVKQNQYDFDNNISMTISNNMESPQSNKQLLGKKDSCQSEQLKSMQGSGESPINIRVNTSSISQQQQMKINNSNQLKLIPQSIKQKAGEEKNNNNNKNKMIQLMKINKDFSQWSQYSRVMQQQQAQQNEINSIFSKPIATKTNLRDNNNKYLQIMAEQEQAQSRILKSSQVEQRSIKSSQQSYHDPQLQIDNDEVRKQKEKNYTQKKKRKFANVRYNINQSQQHNQSDKRDTNQWNDRVQIDVPQPLSFNVGNEEKYKQQVEDKKDEDIDTFPLLVVFNRPDQFAESADKNAFLKNNSQNLDSNYSSTKKYAYEQVNPFNEQKEVGQPFSSNTQQFQQQILQFEPSALIRLQSTQGQIKNCSNCNSEICNMCMYIMCKTCQQQGRPAYEICANCNKLGVTKYHGDHHTFKCCLNKNSRMMGMNNLFDDEENQNQQHQLQNYNYNYNYNDNDNYNLSLEDRKNNSQLLNNSQSNPINNQSKNGSKNIIKSTQSFYLQPQQPPSQKSSKQIQKQTSINNQSIKLPAQQCQNIQQPLTEVYRRKSGQQKNYIERMKYENQNYLKRRKKACQENSKYMLMFGSLYNEVRGSINGSEHSRNSLIDNLRNKNRNQEQYKVEVISKQNLADKGKQSQGYKLSSSVSNSNSNLGLDGKWLNDFDRQHGSFNCLPGKQSMKKNTQSPGKQTKFTTSVVGQQKSNLGQYQIVRKKSNTFSNTDLGGALLPAFPTITSVQNTSVASNQVKYPNISICVSNDPYNKASNYSYNLSVNTTNTLQLPNKKQSPDRSHKSGSPDKSQLSSRIRVDCGDSDSQFDYNNNNKILADSTQMQKKDQKMLSESVKLQQSNNILGKSLAVSQFSSSDDPQNKQSIFIFNQINQNQNKNFHTNSGNFGQSLTTNYSIKTHKCKQDSQTTQNQKRTKNKQRSKSAFQNYDKWGVKQLVQSQQQQSNQRSRSNSRSKSMKSSHPSENKQENKKQRLIMDFLGTIQKSQKLSKSDDSNQNLNQSKSKNNVNKRKRQKVHFNIQDQKFNEEEQRNQKNIGNQSQAEQDFIFTDYNCNQCGEQPVNYRYSCKKCQDYDLCHNCYKKCNKIHQHKSQDFTKFDKKGQLQLQLQQQKIQQQKQQQRNKIISCLIQKFVPKKQSKQQKQKSNAEQSFTSLVRRSLQGKSDITQFGRGSINTNDKNNNSYQSSWRMNNSLVPSRQIGNKSGYFGMDRSSNI